MRRRDVETNQSFKMTRLFLKIIGAWIFLDYLISFFYFLTKPDNNAKPGSSGAYIANHTSSFSNLGYIFPFFAVLLRGLNSVQYREASTDLNKVLYDSGFEKVNEEINHIMTEKPLLFSRKKFIPNGNRSESIRELVLLCQEGDEKGALKLYQSLNVSLKNSEFDGVSPLGAAFWSGNLPLLDILMNELPVDERPNYVDLAKKNKLIYGAPVRSYVSLAHLLALKFKDLTQDKNSAVYWIFRLLNEDTINFRRNDRFLSRTILSGRGINFEEYLRFLVYPMDSGNAGDLYLDSILSEWFRSNNHIIFLKSRYQDYYNCSLSDVVSYEEKLKELHKECNQILAQDLSQECQLPSKFLLRLSRLQFLKEKKVKFFRLDDRWTKSLIAMEQVCYPEKTWSQNLFCQYMIYAVLELDHWMVSQIRKLKNRVVAESGMGFLNEFENWEGRKDSGVNSIIGQQQRRKNYGELK